MKAAEQVPVLPEELLSLNFTPVPDLIAFSIFSFGMLMVLAFSKRPSKRLLNLTSGPDSKKEKSSTG